MRRIRGNSLKLGSVPGMVSPLEMTPEKRSTHLYICGSTGTGKSKMLESLIWQDICQWRKTKCGMLVVDPHGSLYDSIVARLAREQRYFSDVPIVPVDLRDNEWTIGYNVMRRRKETDPAVLINNMILAMSYVYGMESTTQTPLFAREGSNVLWTIYDNDLTLVEAEHLIDRTNPRIRKSLAKKLSRRSVALDAAFSNSLPPKDYDRQVSSTLNRFSGFLRNKMLRLMFGQNGASLDLDRAITEGQIIIVNASTEKGRVTEEDASLFATLLLSDLWTAARERGKGTEAGDIKPFYVYIDEFQNFVTPTIAKNLDQARGFGLHLTLANQFPRQILHAGANGAQVYDSIMANARSKIVFSLEGEENLKPLAQSLFMGVMNPDEIKLKLYSRKVMDYVEKIRVTQSESENWSDGSGEFSGQTETESEGHTVFEDGQEWGGHTSNKANANSSGTSRTSMRGGSRSKNSQIIQEAVFGNELSSVQFRPMEEQHYRAMAALHDQQQRHGVARLAGMNAPANIVTPMMKRPFTTPAMIKSFLTSRYEKLPFALRSQEAHEQIAKREQELISGAGYNANEDEEIPVRRKIA